MKKAKITRLSALGACAIAFTGLAPVPAFAGHIFASNMALPYSLTVDLAGGKLGNVRSLAGQQILTVNNGSTYNGSGLYSLAAWCIDFPHHIYIGSIAIDYAVGVLIDDHISITSAASNSLTVSQEQEIGGLVRYGNQQMGIAPTNLLSAAVQTAIWDIEYGTHYAGSNAALATKITALETMAPTLLSDSGQVLNSFSGGTNLYDFQSLEFNIPEPVAMSVLAVGLLGLVMARRRRNRPLSKTEQGRR